ncbi:hypothetical protein F0562_033830 [Nyssa sinensis]|uniref:Remorin C-terminal domain-containing protein n=1 Tax=Nyssa sinensis TaxID=561372 RepID=A0A5J5AJM2_9ASTE|nr:hypothetical protein F0562_033830 [Nyssa sinensis]
MDSLIKQMRVRFPGVGEEKKEETSGAKDRKIPPQKTQSFKGEKKKTQNWFQRQFFRQMSRDDFSDGGEYAIAVAAAAFAISSLEESSIPDQKKTSEGPATSFTTTKSKTEDTEPGRVSRRFSGEASVKNLEVPDKGAPVSEATNEKMLEKPVGPTPSFRKTPTLGEQLNITGSTKPGSAVPKPDITSSASTEQPALPPTEIKRQSSTIPKIGETEADAWERAEMDKIKERYENLNTKILTWEGNKKKKAKRQIDRTESELEGRRAKALKHYRSEMERINQIAGGAKSQAEENRRNEEFKVKEKANKIRSTGKLPATCFCF